MKETILAYLENEPQGVNVTKLVSEINCTTQQIDELTNAGEIIVSKKGNVKLLKYSGYFKGVLNMHAKGFGFVRLDNNQEVYIPKDAIGPAMPGVNVLLTIDKIQNQKSIQGKIVKVLTRLDIDLVGRYTQDNLVVLDDKRFQRPVLLTNLNGLKPIIDQKVLVHITKPNQGVFEGELIQIIGHKNDPGIDILSIIYTHQFAPTFEQEIILEAEKVGVAIEERALANRRDLTQMNIVTIDGQDAKDLDDAIHVIKNANGFELGVHIADVSHYVEEKSILDKEAFKRSTSVYLADRVVPMLPHILSNGMCSLNELQIRLTLSCVMQIDLNGKVTSYELFPSYIYSKKRFTYDEVNELLLHDNKVLEKQNSAFLDMLKQAHKLSKIIQTARMKRGAIDFDVEESKLVMNDEGQIIDIQKRQRYDAEKLIEDFMIMANECVAKHLFELKHPAIYRVHEKPSEERLAGFQQYTSYIGYPLKINPKEVTPLQLQHYLHHIHKSDIYPILASQLLRTMAKAKYFEDCIGHYGLASEYYTHFTSPIRRYPDLVVHRLLKKYVFNGDITETQLQEQARLMPLVAEQTSKKERDAIACERDVESLKKAEYMVQFVGQSFDGIISSIQAFGMFIELDNTIEGLVHVLDMRDDFYVYDEKLKIFTGQRRRRVYRLGDKVKIKVKVCNIEAKTIDFVLVKEKNSFARNTKKGFTNKKTTFKKKTRKDA